MKTKEYKFLFVDDNQDVLDLLSVVIACEYPHAMMFLSTNNREAFEIAVTHFPDLIFSDLIRPHGNGWDLLQQLHSYSATRNIPVIVVSGFVSPSRNGFEEEERKLYRSGFNWVIGKPFTLDLLKQAAHELLNPNKPP